MLSELLANRCFLDLYLQVCMSCYLTNGCVDLLQLHRPRLAMRFPRDPKPTPVRQAGDDSNREPTPVRRRLHRRHTVSPATGHFRDHVRIGVTELGVTHSKEIRLDICRSLHMYDRICFELSTFFGQSDRVRRWV